MPMLGGDSRSEVDLGLLDDTRVRQFWDEERVLGVWLADTGLGGESASGIVWDAYYVFGPDAEWNERPGPLAGFGSPVVSETGPLARELSPFL
jgi:hypothetical protein